MQSHFSSHTACLRSSLSEGNETVDAVTTILGYARVSTLGQDLDAQLAALAAEGVESDHVFTDKISGAVNTDRPGLTGLLHYAREGDTVVVTAIDRLGRSVVEITRTIADLGQRRILLRALRERRRHRHTDRARGGHHNGDARRTRARARSRAPRRLA